MIIGVAAIAATSLLGHVAVGPVGIGFGWLIPVFIVLVVLRRLAHRR